MTEPRVVNPFSLSAGNGPIRNFGPTVQAVELGKGETKVDPSPGKTEPPVQDRLPIDALTQQPPTPGSPTPQAEVKQESSSATPAPSEPSASSIESGSASSTESGEEKTKPTEKPSASETTSTPSTPSLPSLPEPTTKASK